MTRRSAIIGGLIVVAFGCGAFLVYETDPLLFHESPLRLIDPSVGPEDAALVEALVRALGGPRPIERDPYLNAVRVGALSDAELRRRVEPGRGWDELVVLRGYEHGAELAPDPAISSTFLRWQVAHTDGPPQDGYIRILVVRDQRTVGTVHLQGELETSGVISRSR